MTPDDGPAGASIRVSTLRVTGQTLFSEPELIAASGFVSGSDMTLSQLRGMAAKITAFYNARGYFVAQAYLPAQEIKNGEVAIAVVEGHYGKVAIDNRSPLSTRVARGVLAGLDPGDVVESAPLERRLLLLSDVPGVRVKSTLAPGEMPGSSDLTVELVPGPRVTGSVEADNAGNRYTGRYRFGGTVNLNDPLGIGDMLSLRVLASTAGLAYGRAAYQAPIGNLTVGVAYSRVRYDLGKEFEVLDASGTAEVASVYASYPLIRSRAANVYAVAGFDAKRFTDRVGLLDTESKRSSRVMTGGVNADSRDNFAGGGSTSASLIWSYGALDIKNPFDRAIDAASGRTQGHFNKLAFSGARLQTVTGPLSVYGSVRGQFAFDNLDSSEKMELGGAYGVRAYPEGEAYGDQGYIATAEARLGLSQWLAGVPGSFQAIAFVDVGQVDYAKDPWFVGPNRSHRSGYGGGLSWAGPERILVNATYARKLGSQDATSAPDRAGRFWFGVVKLF
ncbi:ShlB/FhaC/HecB family hemolysin secretion/activation protein [Sphingomonas sp. PB2P19]|uniref:ShlB/FhaC/HecB family hemolysin secretion/activation protein n=1 Tax=Sphingomonas rhamnosi TaxID=3096156 RepID=UPI002FCA653B